MRKRDAKASPDPRYGRTICGFRFRPVERGKLPNSAFPQKVAGRCCVGALIFSSIRRQDLPGVAANR
jgi:hypothetical protein